MASSNPLGWDRKYTLREDEFHEKKLPDDIGVKWRDLARALGFSQTFIDITEKDKIHCARECCIEVLVCWLRREGKDATAEKLFEALVRIGLTNVADKFPCKPCDPSQNLEAVIHDLLEKVDTMGTRINELVDEVDTMGARIKELEDEVLTLRARNRELENGKQQKGEREGNDASEEAKQAARENRVSGILEKCKEDLETNVTKPLTVPEVRQDRLPGTDAVDVLKKLSKHLEEQYNTTLDIAPEARQCSEDLRERFYYFGYHALQAEHDQMNLKISNLKKMLKKAPKDVKKELKNLMLLQKRRKRLVVKLQKRRPQFSPPKPSPNGRCLSDATRKKPEHSHNKITKSEAVIRDLEEMVSHESQYENPLVNLVMPQFEGQVVDAHGLESSDDQLVSTLRARNKELDNGKQQKGEREGNDVSEEAKQAARESNVSEILEKCKEKLETFVTKPLAVPEVRQDNLPSTAVTVDVLKVLSEHLEEQYNTTLDIAREACQCSENLRERFYYLAYHALRAEHNEINLKVNNLKKALKKTPKDVKEEFKNLMRLQKGRKVLVVRLEKFRHLIPTFMPSRNWSDTSGETPAHSHTKEKRRHTFPLRNVGRVNHDTRDEEISLHVRDNEEEEEEEEDVEGPPKFDRCKQVYKLTESAT